MHDLESLKEYVERWRKLGPLLEEIHNREIRETDTTQAIIDLSDAFESDLKLNPPRESSGLVEMQYYFKKLRP